MAAITDEYMHEMLAQTREYCIVILKFVPGRGGQEDRATIWEHGRRNFLLRSQGLLPIVCPCTDDSDVAGLGIFNASAEEVAKIMEEDPGVQEGLFVYELHPCRGFPGSSLP
ncbi:hypothetical protein EPA93_02225 [Ktedonosporobacter rubrisoli]|uniref:YCII-related domain-containing protein n=1 Tax=Ktedonosporobacter rubrisoli TaxID=2509675 RepID=A0A4P6JIY5_KTERU|nr:hypothetical protein [Ktedonosporobacter rubrisoli]QBD74872.1 hypothetical protein EPA93_02225 [Ktedonosporobacter rubrisoli]